MPEGVLQPRLEGSVSLPDGRRLGFAEFGVPEGTPIIWLHGTPGARRQVPPEARRLAVSEKLRIIGVDRPGIGSSTPHLYGSIADHVADLRVLMDRLGIDEASVIGLSGGGPYALAAGAGLAGRVKAVAVLGGVAPTVGDDAIGGGLVSLGKRLAPVISRTRGALGAGITGAIRLAKPLASPALDAYARFSPEGDRRLLNRPEFKAMFLDDLLNGSRKQFSAPLSDVLLFSRHWGFELAEVSVPVGWWHGDCDHIVPYDHGRHVVSRLPDAEFHPLAGESHLGGLDVEAQIFEFLANPAR
ncbi:MAG: alpha/beta hydrolase [Acidimicrobiales bacterium]|nr:alpha/beta hydrolase [Acidimicrobiales bacterium]